MFKVLLPGGSPKRVSLLGREACSERKIRMRLLPVQQQPQEQARQVSLGESFQPADQPADQQADQQADQPADQQPLTTPMDFRSLI